jgi:CDP-2,3-bis-(O-geranylgeranyl)-sn-glycerol synthase
MRVELDMLIPELLFLLLLANGAPVIARNILGERFSWPVDAGARFFDGQPLFGASKTLRGLVFSVAFTALGGWLTGLGWKVGILVATTSMAGDLFSSFIKRRLELPVSSRAAGLDQVPESLFPVLACQQLLNLGVVEVVAIVIIFYVGDEVLSRLFYKLNVRKRPY